MRLARVLTTTIVAVAVSFAAAGLAQERGTRDEAKAMAEAAVEHVKKVGPEQAFKDFSTDKAKWVKKDLYVIAMDMKGVMKAHGTNEKLIGKEQIGMKDANGVQFTVEMIKVAQTKGEGWVDYMWVHPDTKKLAEKTTYVRKLSNYDGWVGVGIYR